MASARSPASRTPSTHERRPRFLWISSGRQIECGFEFVIETETETETEIEIKIKIKIETVGRTLSICSANRHDDLHIRSPCDEGNLGDASGQPL